MSCTTSPADRSKPILPDLDIIATHTGMVVRKSPKLNPTAFLMTVLCNLMRQRFQSAGLSLKGDVIRRAIIEDASSQVMPKGNAVEFPAHGNHHGPTAGAKIDLAYDLLSDEVISHSLQLTPTRHHAG